MPSAQDLRHPAAIGSAAPPPTLRQSALLLVLLLLGARTANAIAHQTAGSLLPLIAADLALDEVQAGLFVGAFLAPGVVLALPLGVLIARLGDVPLLYAGLSMLLIGMLTMASAASFESALAARLLAGVGAVAVMVLASKMLADWFTGPALVLPMMALVNTWPFGTGLGLAFQPGLGLAHGWRWAVLASALPVLVVLLTALVARRRLSRPPERVPTASAALRVVRLEHWRFAMVCVSFGLFGGLWAVVFGLGSSALLGRGMGLEDTSRWMAWVSWCALPMAVAAGCFARWLRHTSALTVAAFVVPGVLLLALPSIAQPLPALLVIGLVGCLPGGLLTARAASLLQPEQRSIGFGVLWTAYFTGVALLPPLAGAAREASGQAEAPLQFAGAVALLAAVSTVLGALRRRTGWPAAGAGDRVLPASRPRGQGPAL